MYPRRLDLEGRLRKPRSEGRERRAFRIGGAARGSASSESTGQGMRRASRLGTLLGSSHFIPRPGVFYDLRPRACPIKYNKTHPSHTKKRVCFVHVLS